MSSVDLSWVLALEIALPFIVLSIVLTMTILAGRKKYKEAAKQLIKSVKSNEGKDKQAILDFQTNKLALNEADAKKNAKKIMNERKFLVRNLVSGLLDKNVEAISQLNQDLARISAHYHALEVANHTPVEPEEEQSKPEGEGLENDISALKSEVKSLKQEVHVTLTTLNNIFKEFSSMFGEDDVPEGQMSVDQIITAMESFSGKQPIDSVVMPEDIEKNANLAEQEAEVAPQEQQPTSSKETNETDTDAEAKPEADDDEVASLEKQLAENLDFPDDNADQDKSELDFSIDSAIDDIDSALDGLELDASDDDEPDWGDAFAESGDKMDEEPK